VPAPNFCICLVLTRGKLSDSGERAFHLLLHAKLAGWVSWKASKQQRPFISEEPSLLKGAVPHVQETWECFDLINCVRLE
jgi:hypothetical protein